jgi:RNA polymerase sigma factor (sigma-70 family)
MIETLSPRRQEIIRLRFFAGLRNQEIAAVLGLDERTISAHLCRALEDLQAKYSHELDEEIQS